MRNDSEFTTSRTADEFRAMAAQCTKDIADSFERCDTDGFLSQWASGQMAGRYLTAADIADRGYTVKRMAIFTLEGEQVEYEAREGQYGQYFFIRSAEGKARFFNESHAHNAVTAVKNNAKKGYYIGWVMRSAALNDFAEIQEGEVVEVIDNGQQKLAELGLIGQLV